MKKKVKIKKPIRKKMSKKKEKVPADLGFAIVAGMAGLGGPLRQF